MDRIIKILIVAPEYPYPPIDGHKVRVYNLVRHLPARYKFYFLAFGTEKVSDCQEDFKERLGPSCENVELISTSTLEPIHLNSLIESIINIFYPFEMSVGEPFYSHVMADRINNLINSRGYDLIYLCGLSIALHFDKRHSHVPFVVDICDSISLLTKSYYKRGGRLPAKLRNYLNYIWADRYEKIHVAGIRNIIMISSVDAERISRNCPKSRIWVLPNGVDTAHFKRPVGARGKTAELLFTGVMNYPPNNEAMIYFIEEIFPLVKQKRLDVTLTIAGREPTHELQSLAGKTSGVKLTGFVEDLRPFFSDAVIYIAPLLSGAGIKNKVLEAWSMSLPVVATPISCAGIMTIENQNILLADSPEDFAAKILTLLSNEALRGRLSSNGRHTAEREYSWMSRSNILSSIFEEVINGSSSHISGGC